MHNKASLVATLGGQAQIVAFTWQKLEEKGEEIDEIYLIYLAGNSRYLNAANKIIQFFENGINQQKIIKVYSTTPQINQVPLAQVQHAQEIESVRQTIFALLQQLKRKSKRIHLSLSGGRRLLALTALSAAMQYLTPADRIWHLYTPPQLASQAEEGALLQLPAQNEVTLIEVPFIPWTSYFPALRPLLGLQANSYSAEEQDEEERARCLQVWQKLSSKQKQLLRTISSGISRSQTASYYGIARSTVDSHCKTIFKHCKLAWQNTKEEEFNKHFIIRVFNPFIQWMDKTYGGEIPYIGDKNPLK